MLNQAYSSVAKFYNRLADHDYGAYYDFVKDAVSGDVVELGAGAGRFTEQYISSVDSAILVDSSSEMLNNLSPALNKYRRKFTVILSDAASFKPFRQVDAVIAVCDVFNYVEDLGKLFKTISSYLKTGGRLVFDVSTGYKLKNIIADNVFYEDYDDVTYIWTNELHDAFVDMFVTVFENKGGAYERSDEHGRQFIHETEDIEHALEAAGFEYILADDGDFTDIKPDSMRIICKAVKK